MNRLNKAQKDKVKRFAAVSDADEKTALAVLKEVRWDLELGLETYFTSPSSHFASANVTRRRWRRRTASTGPRTGRTMTTSSTRSGSSGCAPT